MGEEEAQVQVHLPRALLEYSGGSKPIEVRGGTLAEVLQRVDDVHPGIRERVLNDQGLVRRYVLLFVNRDRVDDVEPEAVIVGPGDEIYIFPSVQGG